mmetsp:Transcript_12314/g.17535  ORF Transcript_12314/g.17535 Transcript_12314/m.17535 type:complete len:143 (-) Transcript_12314:686-1114(-)
MMVMVTRASMSRTIPNALTGWKASPKSKNLSNSSTRIDGEESPRLDRFGLPIRTAENFFPILPPNTELIGVNENTQQPRDHTSGSGSVLQEIRDALVKHVHLNFHIFVISRSPFPRHTVPSTFVPNTSPYEIPMREGWWVGR